MGMCLSVAKGSATALRYALHFAIGAQLGLSAPIIASPTVERITTPESGLVDALFARWSRPDTPGCAVEVSQAGTILLNHAFGVADLEHAIPNESATIFEAGSVSKQFTAAAVLLLVEDGKLKLDDDVHKYVPELPSYGAPITIEMLLNHTSGLRDWASIAFLSGSPRGTREYGMDDVLDIINRQKSLNYRPGERYSYTNSGYNLLAIVVSRVAGQTFQEFLAQRIFRSLGMRSTSWRDNFRRPLAGRAIAYGAAQGGYEQFMPFENVYGNGGLLTTTGDLTRWNEALDANQVGQHVAVDLAKPGVLTDGTRISYASGLIVTRLGDLVEISHPGSTAAYRAWLGRYPERRLSIALLCNAGDVDTENTGRALANIYLGMAPAPPGAAVQPVDPTLSGLYLADDDQGIVIHVDHGGILSADGKPLRQISRSTFHYDSSSHLQFIAPDTLRVVSDNGIRTLHKVVGPSHLPILESYAGSYISDEVGARYIVRVSGRNLDVAIDHFPSRGFRLSQVGDDLFGYPAGIVRFHRSSKGVVDGFQISTTRASRVLFTKEVSR